jgi:hypothetical protein
VGAGRQGHRARRREPADQERAATEASREGVVDGRAIRLALTAQGG